MATAGRRPRWIGALLIVAGLVLVYFGENLFFAPTRQPMRFTTTVCHASSSAPGSYQPIQAEIAVAGSAPGGVTLPSSDIVPPYSSGDFTYPGQNWTAQGRSIWFNACEAGGKAAAQSQPAASLAVTRYTVVAPPRTGESPAAGLPESIAGVARNEMLSRAVGAIYVLIGLIGVVGGAAVRMR